MDYKLFPNPVSDMCTPFVYAMDKKKYQRYYLNPNPQLIELEFGDTGIMIAGCNYKNIIGENIPHRKLLLAYVERYCRCNCDFRDYIKNTHVVPTFTLSKEESFVKTVIRQIISATQAKKLFSSFIKIFGYEKDGIYGFPNSETIAQISYNDLKYLGLGFRARRVLAGLKMIRDGRDTSELNGIGPWSKSILKVEANKDYAMYPFWDKSGQKINRFCNMNLQAVAKHNTAIAGGLYLYAASYLESQ